MFSIPDNARQVQAVEAIKITVTTLIAIRVCKNCNDEQIEKDFSG